MSETIAITGKSVKLFKGHYTSFMPSATINVARHSIHVGHNVDKILREVAGHVIPTEAVRDTFECSYCYQIFRIRVQTDGTVQELILTLRSRRWGYEAGQAGTLAQMSLIDAPRKRWVRNRKPSGT
ncbi:MAG: hypothetical protein ACREYE_00475 [Gammaproteobacteria bacterium]